MTDLGTLGGTTSSAFHISDDGGVFGYSTTAQPVPGHGFFYRDGVMTDLGARGGAFFEAAALNDAGHIVGSTDVFGTQRVRAFLHDGGSMIDLNTRIDSALGWELIQAHDINSSGQIIGYGYFNGSSRGFLLTPSNTPVSHAPEPATWLMLMGGFAAIGGATRRARRVRATVRFS
jgi:probable HAF family extracellular repeat protein